MTTENATASMNPLIEEDTVELTDHQQKWHDQEFISSVDVNLVKLKKTEDNFSTYPLITFLS